MRCLGSQREEIGSKGFGVCWFRPWLGFAREVEKKGNRLNKLIDWKEKKGMRMQILLTGEYRSVESRLR